MSVINDSVEELKNLIKSVLDFIKKIFVKIIEFFRNIVNFVKKLHQKYKYRKGIKMVSVKINDLIKEEEYNIYTGVFNTETGELENYEEDSEIISGENIDEETKKAFGSKELVIFE